MPLISTRSYDLAQRSEAFKKQPRSLDRDPRGCREGCLGRVRPGPLEPLRIWRPIAIRRQLPSHGQSLEPERCFSTVASTKDNEAEVRDCEPQATECLLVDRARGETFAFDEEIRPRCYAPQFSNLHPKPALDQRSLQIEHALSLDYCTVPHDVVAHWQALSNHGDPEFFKTFGNAGRDFVHIGCHDDHRVKCRFGFAEERNEFVNLATISHFAKAKWQ